MFDLLYTYQTNYYSPPVDVIETDTGFMVRIEIAGMNEKDFNIKFDQNILLVHGNRHDPIRNQAFQQMGIHFGEFRIEININHPINADEITAEYQNGFLSIILINAKPHEIPIINKDS
jgi:HSP20 family protein